MYSFSMRKVCSAGMLSDQGREALDIGIDDRGLGPDRRQIAPVLDQCGGDAVRDIFAEDLADELHLLDDGVAQPFLLEAGIYPCPQQQRIEGLGQIVLGTELDAGDDALKLLERAR